MPSDSIADLGRRAKAAARVLATTGTDAKDAALHAAAELLVTRSPEVLAANATDVAHAEFGEGQVMRSDGDTLTVLFEGGYRNLSLAAVLERGLLTPT